MSDASPVGHVARLWRFPVKSMRGEQLPDAVLTEHGFLGDRAYGLIDAETGKVVSAKSVKRFPGLFACHASFVEPPQTGHPLPPVQIDLPDGTVVMSDSGDASERLSAHFGHQVRLVRAAPEDYTIDQYHPDVEDLTPGGDRNAIVDQKLGSALFDQLGMPSPVPVGSLVDAFPVSILTTSTVAHLETLSPKSNFDERRFRSNVTVETPDDGFVENQWLGRGLGIGDQVKLAVAMPDPRCVMTTLAQEELPKDTEILRTLAQHNRLPLGEIGLYPCAGVYAVVAAPGALRAGDPVFLS